MKITRELLAASWRSWTSNDLQRVGPYWLQLMWTALFATAVGVLFTVAGFTMHARRTQDWTSWPNWQHWLGLNLFVSFFVAYFIHLLFEVMIRLIGTARIRRWKEWQRGLFFSGLPIGGVMVSWPIAVNLAGYQFNIGSELSPTNVSGGMLLFVAMFSALTIVYFDGEARAQAAERRAAESQLRLLQGQIEPHFLFNTLANVVGLIDADPARARRMLESFIDYLRSSLGSLRQQNHTLGQEMALVDAYLRVLALRMEERLRVHLEVPAELMGVCLPAVLVQPLVENAIHHGLEPKVDGGQVTVRAHTTGRALLIEVIDDGLGLPPADTLPPAHHRPGTGAALANIRERLAAAYGSAAGLELLPRPDGGVLARLSLPWPMPQAPTTTC
ncbi:MAG: histidine kinase [Vitreoscilla sp.]|nr:histidine kinase [Vitreoscilla sp.]